MPNLRVINQRSGAADFKVGSQSYKLIFTNMRFETHVNMDDETTFGDEPDPVYGEGATVSRFSVGGLMKEGDVGAAPLIPMPQNQAITMNFGGNGTNGNKITFTGNFSDHVSERSTMQKGVVAEQGIVTGPIVVTWNTTT